ncbi:CU044_5270 family protein [Actinomadura rifamycini]|uniref:CU044_5270 family protein n=1 Tax=Actinomadura rifamycini TaxID=31962 RepID=UPI0004281151|nr:CU044_5270 family protein [Actinomadura rifamycini]
MTDLAPPPRRDLPPDRHELRRAHLLTELAPPAAAPRRASRARAAATAVAALGLAFGTALAIAVAPGTGPRPGPSGPPPMANAAAVDVLNRASRAAAAGPVLHPRPDQFFYFESKQYQDGTTELRRAWFPVDTRSAGLVRNSETEDGMWVCEGNEAWQERETAAGAAGRPVPVDLANPPADCGNRDVRVRGLPSDAAEMRRWLYRNSDGDNPPDVQAFVTVGDTIRERYVPPETLSVLFAAAARIPGVTVARGVTDPAGRTGVAVGVTWRGVRHELIFDAGTYAFLGERQVVGTASTRRPEDAPGEPGEVLYASAELRTAVTDRAGQIPE